MADPLQYSPASASLCNAPQQCVSLAQIAVANPPFRYTTDEILQLSAGWLPGARTSDFFSRILNSAGVEQRAFGLPIPELLALPGQERRAAVFHEAGTALACQTIKQLKGVDLNEIETLIFTSCSVPTIPALDTYLINALELPRTITRIPLYQHGCIGGAFGLALASRLCTPHNPPAQVVSGKILLLALELCSLVFQPSDHRDGSLIGCTLFADGCAAAIIEPNNPQGLKILASQSYLIPDSTHLMGYEILDDGSHLLLLREIPQAIAAHLPPLVRSFLARYGTTPEEIKYWLPHPGGARIVADLEAVFKLEREQTQWSWKVLEDHGNMSSATILFVFEKFMQAAPYSPGDLALAIGIGPGLTLQVILLQC